MGHYGNFKTVVYIPAHVANAFTREKLENDHAFLEKYIGLDKVYLETHRGRDDVNKEQLLMIKGFLEDKGVEVSGGITTIIEDEEYNSSRLFNTICYTDPKMRKRIKEVSEFSAEIFDEVILDDFYFTSCTCERCIKEKGDRDWVTFRRELMMDVSKNLIVDPAKSVNPNVKMVIKYPNWRESFHFTGYLPGLQKDVFDATYIGTETRSPAYTDQHLPEYLSYSLVRFIENAWPGGSGGGWFDSYQCWSIDRYLEQAYLTAFGRAKELMHFQWDDLINNPFVGAMGIQLNKIDKMLDEVGEPCGIPVYIPHDSCGENHLEMRLGMMGLPVEPTPVFPEKGRILLTETSAGDKDVVNKLEKFIREGGDAVITSGFLGAAGDELIKAGLTECALTGRKYGVTRYHVTGDNAGYIEHRDPILFPELEHGNNSSWSLLNGGDGDLHTSLFLRRTYGKGRLYIMAVPDNAADLYRMPRGAVDVLKRALVSKEHDTYASGRNFSMFTYDDGSMILYRYVKADLRPAHVTLHTITKHGELKDVTRNATVPVHEVNFREDFEKCTEYVADIEINPGEFKVFKWA